jgi:hypothetical protein
MKKSESSRLAVSVGPLGGTSSSCLCGDLAVLFPDFLEGQGNNLSVATHISTSDSILVLLCALHRSPILTKPLQVSVEGLKEI